MKDSFMNFCVTSTLAACLVPIGVHADTNSYYTDGKNLSFKTGTVTPLFSTVASFDGNQLQLSNNALVAVEAVIRNRNGEIITTTLIPPAGGPLGAALNPLVYETIGKALNTFETGTPMTASIARTGLTAEQIQQGVSIEIVAGSKRAQTLTALNIVVENFMLAAKATGLIVSSPDASTKTISQESQAILKKYAEKLMTDGAAQASIASGNLKSTVLMESAKQALIEIALVEGAKFGLQKLVGSATSIVAEPYLKKLEAVGLYESVWTSAIELNTFKTLSDNGRQISTGFLALQINGQTPDYVLKSATDTYKLNIISGYFGVNMATLVPTNVNENTSSSSLPANLGTEAVQQAKGPSGGLVWITGTTTLSGVYDNSHTNRWTTNGNGGDMVAWNFSADGQTGRGAVNTAAIVDKGSTATAEGSIYWGRWLGNTQVTDNNGASFTGRTVHYAYGDPVVAMPLNRQFTYSLAGGTPFTSAASGAVGDVLRSGTITVNTGTRAMQFNNLVFGYTTSSPFGAATFTMNGASTYNQAGFNFKSTLSGTCSGGSCGASVAAGGGVAGGFTGKTGTGIALIYGAATSGGVGGMGAAAFKR